MRLNHLRLPFRQSVLTAVALAASPLAGAATLTIIPSSTSNTFSGPLTLQINGLTNGETVIVEKYLDLSQDLVLQANEPLIDTFSISESGVSIIGGVTNLNVPYDSNSATDTITTTLSFVPPLENVTSQFIFRLLSPTGGFAPQTAFFSITNAALNQSVNGTVYNGVTPVPNAVVVALRPPNGNYVGAVVADNSSPGHYRLNLDPGSYLLIPVLQNYVTDQSQAPVVTLTNGQAVTNSLFLTNGTVTISGKVYDASNSNGVGGVFLQLESDNLFGIAFTDSNGNFSAAVTPGNWRVKVDGSRIARSGHVRPSDQPQVDTSTGSVANVNIALPRANALFYGRIKDGSNAPLAGINFFAQENSNDSEADGFSDANGNYAVGILANGNEWNCFPDSGNSPLLAGYVLSSGVGQTNISPGQAVLQNFTALIATARISGHVRDNSGNPVTELGINSSATIGGTTYQAFGDTDGSGNYSIAAVAGTWSVYANCCGDNGLDNHGLTDFFQQHTVVIPPTNAVMNFTLYPVGTPLLTQVSRFGSSCGFNLFGAPGNNYTVEATTNLALGNWFTVVSITNLPFNSQFISDNNATNAARFYRARRVP